MTAQVLGPLDESDLAHLDADQAFTGLNDFTGGLTKDGVDAATVDQLPEAGPGITIAGRIISRAPSTTGFANLAALPPAAEHAGLMVRTADGGMYESDGAGWQIVRDPAGTYASGSTVRPEDFDPGVGLGDVAVDDAALAAAVATGKHVQLTNGVTYLYYGQLDGFLPWQQIKGPGAILKRYRQAHSTTATPVTVATTIYNLADASDFRVGMRVSFVDSSALKTDLVAGLTLSTNQAKILGIVGNTVTLDRAPNKSAHTGHDVYSTGFGVVPNMFGTVEDVRCDGNKAETPWSRWEVVAEFGIFNGMDLVKAVRCSAVNAPGEAMQARGAWTIIEDFFADSPGGNGIHLAASTHVVIRNPTILHPNQDQTNGHVMGCIGWSQQIGDATMTEGYLEGGVAGLSMTGPSNSDVTASGMTIRGCETALQVTGGAGRIILSEMRVYDCGLGLDLDTNLSVPASQGKAVAIKSSEFHNSPLLVNDAYQSSITDCDLFDSDVVLSVSGDIDYLLNRHYGSTLTPTSLRDNCHLDDNKFYFEGDTTTTVVEFLGAFGDADTFNRNTIHGGGTGVDQGHSGTNFEACNNTLDGQHTIGATIGRTDGTLTGVAKGNRATCAADSVNWTGLIVKAGILHEDNDVVNPFTAVQGRYGMRVQGAALVNKNTVLGLYAIGTIVVDAGVVGASLARNTTNAPIVDNGTGTRMAGLGNIDDTTTGATLPTFIDLGDSAGAKNLNCALLNPAGGTFRIRLTSGSPILTLQNMTPGQAITLLLIQDGTGGRGYTLAHASLPFIYDGGGGPPGLSGVPDKPDKLSVESDPAAIYVNRVGKAYA